MTFGAISTLLRTPQALQHHNHVHEGGRTQELPDPGAADKLVQLAAAQLIHKKARQKPCDTQIKCTSPQLHDPVLSLCSFLWHSDAAYTNNAHDMLGNDTHITPTLQRTT